MGYKISFIGLGVMGYPMAGYISKAGHDVTVYNRTKAKAEKWAKEYKGKVAYTPMDAAKDCDFIFTCVGNDNDLREVTLGDKGLVKSVKKALKSIPEINVNDDKVDTVIEKLKTVATKQSKKSEDIMRAKKILSDYKTSYDHAQAVA